MLIITDEDVPDQVTEFLASRGHEVLMARDKFLPGTKDYVIAEGVSELHAVLVTWNRRHFKNLAKRKNSKGELSYPNMSVITFSCAHPRGLSRLELLMEEIEDLYGRRIVQRGGRMVVDIGDTVLRAEDA